MEIEKALKLKFEWGGFTAALNGYENFSSKMWGKEKVEKVALEGQDEDRRIKLLSCHQLESKVLNKLAIDAYFD